MLQNADGKAAYEIASNSEMRAACEPSIEVPGYNPEEDADAEAAAAENENSDDDDEDEE